MNFCKFDKFQRQQRKIFAPTAHFLIFQPVLNNFGYFISPCSVKIYIFGGHMLVSEFRPWNFGPPPKFWSGYAPDSSTTTTFLPTAYSINQTQYHFHTEIILKYTDIHMPQRSTARAESGLINSLDHLSITCKELHHNH